MGAGDGGAFNDVVDRAAGGGGGGGGGVGADGCFGGGIGACEGVSGEDAAGAEDLEGAYMGHTL